MLEEYRQQYANNRLQFVFIDHQGVIVDSDQAFIKFDKKESLYDAHPFFECLSHLDKTPEAQTTFTCVNLLIKNIDYTLDIDVIYKEEGVLLIFHNLTEHYFSYQTIAQSRNESIISSELVVIKNLELEERERFKNAFIQNFSHELRNPLTSIISITKIIGDTELSSEQRKMIDFLKESNSNLRLMLEDILSISSIASGKLNLENKIFNLSELLQLLEFTYKAKAKEKGLDFKIKKAIKIPEFVEGDRLRLFQVLTNLLDNAIKYTNQGGIVFQVLYNQKRANRISMRFEISDTGIGIPKESQDVIFESFEQLDGNANQQGTGLGLAIVNGLLKLMGTEIRLESKQGEGSKFYFDITLNYPLQLASKPLPKPLKKKNVKPKIPKGGSKFKLLLVEDDISVGMVLFKTLMNTKLFYIDSLNDGAMVMEHVINATYDIILMDVNLPNVSGDHITRLIRGFPFKNIKSIPIIGITSNAYDDDIKSFLNAGMNAVVTKPFDDETLLDIIFKHLK